MVTYYSQLSSMQKQQIIDAFNKGVECRHIPAILHVSERAVARVLAESGVNTKRRNRYTLDESYFNCIDSHAKSYLLGLLAADGCVTSTNYIAFESIDRELTELLKLELQYSGEIRLTRFQDYEPHHRINFSSKQLATALRKWGVTTGRSFADTCYFPESEYLSSYLLGYFDGDGCAYVNQGRSGGLVCIVGSLEFTSGLVKRLGMGTVEPHSARRVYYWRIYSRANIGAFYQLIYQHQPLGLLRKKQKIEQILGSYKRG
ncbi:MAG: hypothetical protein Kow00121_44700 [Elainellaceae cyanobacterium]